MSVIRKWLEREVELLERQAPGQLVPGPYGRPQSFVLTEGRSFPARSFDEARFGPKQPDRECYRNAFILAVEHRDELTYVEGYAARYGGLVVPHAWCVTRRLRDLDQPEDVVVDPTWVPVGDEYLGVELPLNFVADLIHERGSYGVIDDWEHGYPILRRSLEEQLR